MSDIIQILPDSVANQIAAGEVVQRPSSVVKELVENAIDAHATLIKIIIKDAGKTLIQIIDNGIGMSETDARLAFERHATSKIKKATDLFAISTFGFRGEALASIAAVAQVELKTKKNDDEIGTCICINGSEFEKQEPVSCEKGSVFTVKNLFYNIPARRRFLKSDNVELRHILDEFHRTAIAHPEVSFLLINNGTEMFNLQQSTIKQRIVNIFGKNLNNELLNTSVETSIATIDGFIGKPENARKTKGLQFFFVNNRFMKHPFFYKTLTNAYQNLCPRETTPSFFLFFKIKPDLIDVNIHPTKTEIKFENEYAVSQILEAVVKQTLGKTNMIPSIDFENEQFFDILPLKSGEQVVEPKVNINTNYNPFNNSTFQKDNFESQRQSTNGWQELYKIIEKKDEETENNNLQNKDEKNFRRQCFSFKGKYILSQVKSGLMVIDQHLAHERILYEEFDKAFSENKITVQNLLFPFNFELNNNEALLFENLLPELALIGFSINKQTKNSFIVKGIPSVLKVSDIKDSLEKLISDFQSNEKVTNNTEKSVFIKKIIKSSVINYGKYLSNEEMNYIIDNLFATSNPNYSLTGRAIFKIINFEEIEKLFN